MAGIAKSATTTSAVKKKQLILMGALVSVVVIVAFMVATLGGGKAPPAAEKSGETITKKFGGTEEKTNPQDIWRTAEGARVSALQQQVADMEARYKAAEEQRKNEEARREQERAAEAKRQEDLQKAAAATATMPPQGSLPPKDGANRTAAQLGAPSAPSSEGRAPAGETVRGIVRVEVSKDAGSPVGVTPVAMPGAKGERKAGPADAKTKSTENYLPTGAFLRAVNLSGIDAPTGGQAQQNPYPIVFRVLELAQLPNKFKADYKECFVTGNGHGDLSSERALIRLDRLSCVAEDGAAIDVDVKGFVADNDGRAGMRGRLVSKQGQVLGNALLAGIASGIGQAFVQTNSATSVSPLGATQTVVPGREMQVGIGQGVGKSLDRLANYFISMADKIFPVIEVDSGRPVDLVITRGISIER